MCYDDQRALLRLVGGRAATCAPANAGTSCGVDRNATAGSPGEAKSAGNRGVSQFRGESVTRPA
jgi:hypothetical protein